MPKFESVVHPLDSEGRTFLQSTLDGERGLARKLTARIGSGGSIFSVLPAATSSDHALKFEQMTGARSVMWTWLNERVEHLLQMHADGIMVLQDVWMLPEDKSRDTHNSWIACNNHVYLMLSPSCSAANICSAIRAIASFKLVGAFVAPMQLPTGNNIDEAHVTTLAERAIEIFVSAYDQDGLVVWRCE